MAGQCPRCSQSITAAPDAQGLLVCGSCGLKLRSMGAQPPATLDVQAVLDELRLLRRMQGEILQLQAQILNTIKAAPPRAAAPAAPAAPATSTPPTPTRVEPAATGVPDEDASAPVLPRVRQRRKTVLLVDDDEVSRQAAVAALKEVQVPLREVTSGHAAIAAIAEDKPDVLVLELAMGGDLPGRDFINMVKATMEWIDIPIVLYTWEKLADTRDARNLHGFDELVLKGPGSAEALVNRVIQVFQRSSR